MIIPKWYMSGKKIEFFFSNTYKNKNWIEQTNKKMTTTNQQANQQANHYDIWVKPIFVEENGSEYLFEGLDAVELEHRGKNFEFRFIINTLRQYFGDNLDFDVSGNQVKILTLSNDQMNILREIHEYSCEFPLKYDRAHLKFEIEAV